MTTPPSLSLRNHDGIARAIELLKPQFADRLQTGAAICQQHGHTTTWIGNQPPDAVIFVETAQEVSRVMQLASDYRVPIIPFGTGSSLEGHVNAPRGGISLDFSRMNKILAVNAEDMDVVVQPGVTREALNSYLRDTGLFFPVDPGANASLGGMAATRASGTNAVRYGTMKDNVLALKAVMANGQEVQTATRARKSAAGYDLTRLLVGSEGTLGIITELTLRLQGIPEAISAATCSFPSVEAACNAVIMTIQMGLPMARIELVDGLTVRGLNAASGLGLPEGPMLFLEFHGSEAGVREQAESFGEIAEEHGASGFQFTTKEEERNKLWAARHNAYYASLALRPGARGISTDCCVPVSRLAECVSAAQAKAEELGLISPIVGHVGDGNFHCLPLIFMEDADEVERARGFVSWLNKLAISMGGTCTGEHGIGQGKADYLIEELGPGAIEMMAAVKHALDPLDILNPGKIIIADL